MALSHVLRDSLLQLGKRPPSWFPLEERVVQVLRRVAASTTDDDRRTLLVPLENGTRADPEPPPYLGGNRDLTLRGETRLSK
jgi:hypothetical protein